MEPHAFVAEVYRRMSLRQPLKKWETWEQMENDPTVEQATHVYAPLLPQNPDAAILDLGFGRGWFIAACLKHGYTNVYGADFGIAWKSHVRDWSSSVKGLHEIETNIGDFLAGYKERFDLIHMSHVIEHIPKYSLLYRGCSVLGSETGWRSPVADSKHGGPVRDVQPLRDPGARVRFCRIELEFVAEHL